MGLEAVEVGYHAQPRDFSPLSQSPPSLPTLPRAFNGLPRYLETPARHLLKRCVQCPDGNPSCPTCSAGQTCALNVKDCYNCASATCVAAPGATQTQAPAPSSPAGAIAGGVIGGIVLIAALVGLYYWFYVRPRKQSWAVEQLENLKEIPTPDNRSFSEARSHRASTHTVASVKTNGTRASIPIAYIPGVTSRNDAHSPDIIPPVPPIPAAGGAAAGTLSPRMNTGTEVFFRPESTYSDIDLDRKSIARSTRSSVSSTYHDAAVIDPMPAQAVFASRATSISLSRSSSKMSSPSRSPTGTPPPLSHQSSIASRMQGQGPITGQSGQARQIMITRSQSNLRSGMTNSAMNTIAELDDTSTGAPTPRIMASELDDTSVGYRTPKIGIDRSGTASPRSMLSDDAEDLMASGRWRKPGDAGPQGYKSPDLNHPPVSASGQSTFSKASPVSAMGWDPQANIRNTIQAAANMGYGQINNYGRPTQDTSYGGPGGDNGNQPNSPFADRHAMR